MVSVFDIQPLRRYAEIRRAIPNASRGVDRNNSRRRAHRHRRRDPGRAHHRELGQFAIELHCGRAGECSAVDGDQRADRSAGRGVAGDLGRYHEVGAAQTGAEGVGHADLAGDGTVRYVTANPIYERHVAVRSL